MSVVVIISIHPNTPLNSTKIKFMKTTLLILLGLIITPASFAASKEEICEKRLEKHLNVIEASQKLIASFAPRAVEMKPFEVTKLQESLTARYASLKSFMSYYEHAPSECGSPLTSKAVAIYDFSVFGKAVLENTELRRMVVNFTKYEKFGLSDYITSYKQYTSNRYISKIQKAIAEEDEAIAKGIVIERSVKKSFSSIGDKSMKAAGLALAGIAKFWGFISDHLRWRQGRLQHSTEALELMKKSLKPLDLIYEKKTFVLSNYTIPGNWGHVAIWLGTKKELQALGVWDEDYFAPFKAQVLAGKSIVEIRKQGVNYQSLEEFMNLDEVAVTRVNNILDSADKVFSGLASQTDKKYDFQFDAHSMNKITCAEFIAFAYGEIDWPQTKTLYTTLRPDDIAIVSTYKKNAPAKFVLHLKGQKDGSFQKATVAEWNAMFAKPKVIAPAINEATSGVDYPRR